MEVRFDMCAFGLNNCVYPGFKSANHILQSELAYTPLRLIHDSTLFHSAHTTTARRVGLRPAPLVGAVTSVQSN
jgi:hypothetical protein